MAKVISDSVLDGAFAVIKTATRMTVTYGQPVVFADIATLRLAEATMTPADFVTAAGNVSGRKVTMASKFAVPVTRSNNATHIVLHDNVSTMLYVTTCTTLTLTSGTTINIPTWRIEIGAPT
jgi:hypothetical protein